MSTRMMPAPRNQAQAMPQDEGTRRMQLLQRQLEEIEQQVSHKYGNRGPGMTNAQNPVDQGSQAVLMAELQGVRNLLSDGLNAVKDNAKRTALLEEDYDIKLEELRTSKQQLQASEMTLKLQTETVERLNEQILKMTEELKASRDTSNEWRSKAEELRLKLERLTGSGDGLSVPELQQELNRTEVRLAEANRLRLLDAEELAKRKAELDRMGELENRAIAAEKTVRELRRESDDYRSQAEARSAELMAWRSKSETWEASKAQSVRALQQERDRLQAEWQMMRESLQSAEASLAVQTAAVTRLEDQLRDAEQRMRESNRALEGWEEKEQNWKTEILALRTRMEAETNSKDSKIARLQKEKEALEQDVSERDRSLQSAEASLAVQTAAVQRVEKQAATLMVEVRQARRSEEEWRIHGENARGEIQKLEKQLEHKDGEMNRYKTDYHELQERSANAIDSWTKRYNEADATAKVTAEENSRLQKEIKNLADEIKNLRDWQMKAERLASELAIARGIMNASGGQSEAGAVKEDRDALKAELEKLRPKLEEANVELAKAKVKITQLEANLETKEANCADLEGKLLKMKGELEGYKAELTSLRMQLEDCTARSEYAITTLREERDLLSAELERLRNALQAASAEVNIGMQSVAKLSNIDARTVSSQVRVYGDSQGMQNRLHMQMESFQQTVGALRSGNFSALGANQRPGGAATQDEFRPAQGRVRRQRRDGGQPPDGGGEVGLSAGPRNLAGTAGGALLRSRSGAAGEMEGMEREEIGYGPAPVSGRVHRPSSGKYVPPPPRFVQKDFTKYSDIKVVAKAAEWLSIQKGRPGAMPTDADFRAAGMSGVADAIAKIHGGSETVAATLNYQIHHSMKPMAIGQDSGDPSRWNKFGHVQQAILELAEVLCAPDTMPSYTAMRSAGLGQVADAVRKRHGGLQAVADRLGLQLPSAFAE